MARGAKLIVVDPRKSGVAEKADLWLQVRPGSDGALALSMIHVLLEEKLYDEDFTRDWTNGPFLVRADDQRLLTKRDLSPEGDAERFLVWDERSQGLVTYRADHGYARDRGSPALSGTRAITLADGKTVECWPALQLLTELAAHYAPERSEQEAWVRAQDVRRAVRMFGAEKPSCYYSWSGIEQQSDATQTNRAICLFEPNKTPEALR